MINEDVRIPVVIFKNKDDNQPEPFDMTWPALAKRLCRYTERTSKDGKAWSPVTYLPGTTRGKANVDQVFALVLDLDHGGNYWPLLEGREYLAHTTFQHTPEEPRWRVTLPLGKPVSGAEWPAFWLRANAYFGGCVDPATKDASRIFYLPSCPPGGQHEEKWQHGDLLDPDSLPEVPVYEPPSVERRNGSSPVMTRHLADWAARFCLAKTDELAAIPPGGGRNSACNRVAHLLAGLVADPLHDLRHEWVEERLLEACERNGLTHDDGGRSVRATIRSGFDTGLLRPWSPADQDPLLPTRPYVRSYDKPDLRVVEPVRLDIVRMDEVEVEPIDWLWYGRLARGKLTLLMGDPGLGKSLITHWLSALLSTGGDWPDGGACAKAASIIFTIEDALGDTVKPRLVAAGADMNRVIAVRGVVNQKASLDARMFALEEHIALLEELIRDEHAALVVMDPISAYLGANVNAHKETDVRRVLGPLALMAERTGVAILMLIHLNKGKDVAALNRATGSVAFPAVSRIVLGVVPDPLDEDGERRLLLTLKCNVSRKIPGLGYRIESAPSSALLLRVDDRDRPPVLIWDNDPVLDDMSIALDRGSVQERTATEQVISVLIQLFANNGQQKILSRQIDEELRAAGVSTSGSVKDSAKSQLGIRSWQESFGGRWYYLPPTRIPRRVSAESTDSLARAHAQARAITFTDSGSDGDSGDNGEPAPASASVQPNTPTIRQNPPKSPESDQKPRAGEAVVYCHNCRRFFADDAEYQAHMPCSGETLPPGLCPVHRKLFSLHDCDQL